MLDSFEEYTEDILKPHEIEFARDMARAFMNRIGPEKAITSTEIIATYKKKGIKLTPEKIRKYVNYICKHFVPNLVGRGKGYYTTNNIEDLQKRAAVLRSRANENIRREQILLDYIETLKKDGTNQII